MGLLIQVIAIVAILGGAWFAIDRAWTGFKDGIGRPYAAAQLAADQPQIDKAKKAQTDAEGERDRARQDTEGCKVTLGTQTGEIKRLATLAEKNFTLAKEARAQASRDATAAAPYIADLQAKAGAAPKLQSCQEELTAAKGVLRKALENRRAIPETGAPK